MGIEGNVVILQAAVLSIGSHMIESRFCHTRPGFPVNFQQQGIFKVSLERLYLPGRMQAISQWHVDRAELAIKPL